MKIYHGSKDVIQTPVFGYGKEYNDYGLGFYCTDDLDLAKEWAVDRNRNSYANEYELNLSMLTTLDLNSEEYCILHWLTILLENREFDIPSPLAAGAKEYLLKNFLIDYNKADIITGYCADDSYFSFAQDFINGTISYRQFNNAMRLGDLGQQLVLKSKSAFDAITYIGHQLADSKQWFAKKEYQDKVARREYFDVQRNKRQKGDIYITHG